jgi:hypothetical protein
MDLQRLLDEISTTLRQQADRLDQYRLTLTSAGGTEPVVSVRPNDAYVAQLNQMATELQKAHKLNEDLSQQVMTLQGQLANARQANLAA